MPWGLPYPSQKEYNRHAIRNNLLRVTVLFFYAAISYGTPAIVEHPITVEDETQAASSWLLPEIHDIIKLAAVTMVHSDQCMLGQVSIKPTTLLCVCAQQVTTRINQQPNHFRCNRSADNDNFQA